MEGLTRLQLPTLLPPTYPFIHATCDITVVVKKYVAPGSVSYIANRNSYRTLVKDCSCYTVYLAWLQSGTRKPQWFQYFKLEFLGNTKCEHSVGLPKSGHICLIDR